MRSPLSQLTRAIVVLLGALALSCGPDESGDPDVRIDSSVASTVPAAESPMVGDTVPARWEARSIVIGPVYRDELIASVEMAGGHPRMTTLDGGDQLDTLRGPGRDTAVHLLYKPQSYTIVPYADADGGRFLSPDPGYPQDAELGSFNRSRVYEFTDPADGDITRITIVMQDLDETDDSTRAGG
jgi:hypothetical protein